MGPAFQRAYDVGIKPLIANEITAEQAFERSSGPFKEFMLKNVRDKDLKLFNDLAKEPLPAAPEQMSLRILIPAFMISELKRAFEIGFLLFLPFLIIDLVVASVLMSMGMMMLPPVVVSLPFKLIFFVLVDGWSLVAGSLVQSYGGGSPPPPPPAFLFFPPPRLGCAPPHPASAASPPSLSLSIPGGVHSHNCKVTGSMKNERSNLDWNFETVENTQLLGAYLPKDIKGNLRA